MISRSMTMTGAGSRGLAWLAALFVGLALLVVGGMQAARAQNPGSPELLVQRVTGEVLTAIKADPSVQSGDPQRLLKLVDEKILPYVDFEKTTRLAAGRYWRQATPEQQKALIKEFRTTLVRTYSGAVSSVKQQTAVELRPTHYAADATDVVVRTAIKQPAGDPIPVDYRMEKSGQGWKIYDVNVLGVWLIENYRNQFSQQIGQNGIDGLIKSLAERNSVYK